MDIGEGQTSFHAAGTTGRYLVLLEEDAAGAAARELREVAGLRVLSTADTDEGVPSPEQAGEADGVVFHELGVAVVAASPEQVERLGPAGGGKSAIALVEPERIVYALGGPPFATEALGAAGGVAGVSAEYLRGYRDAVLHLSSPAGPSGRTGQVLAPLAGAPPIDESRVTWGLLAVTAQSSPFSGTGVRVAVLDTGIDQRHPDFADRGIAVRSFVVGEEVQDGHGHGTHCVGTACGPRVPGELPRYGVACEAEVYAGKVLSDAGRGQDESILAGIQWAVTNRCRIVSLSLGAPTSPGQPYSRVFQRVARRARRRGTAIIAAAGNDSRRESGEVRPVCHPANCPSIMAVGALDWQLQVAPFSNQGQETGGGQIDFAAPGVDVHSSWPMPTRYRRLSGTSMATPHAAGVAALLAESEPEAGAGELMGLLSETALRLSLGSVDVGAGLVQAP